MSRQIKGRKIFYYVEDEPVDKRKLVYLLILLLFTGIFLSTSTYAWFTTNRMVSVDVIDVKIQTEGSLEISADAVNFKAGITANDIMGAHNGNYPASVNQLPAYIEPVSSAGVVDNRGFLEMYLGVITSNSDGDYIVTSRKSVESEGNGEFSDGKFVAFDVFLRTSADKDLYLTNESQVKYNGEANSGVENAIRVAFVIEGHTGINDPLGAMHSLRTNSQNNVYIWEPNYDTHTETGINHAREVYGITTVGSGAARISYDGIRSEFGEGANVTFARATSASYPNYFSGVNPNIQTVNGNTTYQRLWLLETGVTKVRVYLWLEGQDVDCENGASVGNIQFTLQFSTNPS